jgi:hypothetical protein
MRIVRIVRVVSKAFLLVMSVLRNGIGMGGGSTPPRRLFLVTMSTAGRIGERAQPAWREMRDADSVMAHDSDSLGVTAAGGTAMLRTHRGAGRRLGSTCRARESSGMGSASTTRAMPLRLAASTQFVGELHRLGAAAAVLTAATMRRDCDAPKFEGAEVSLGAWPRAQA